MRAKLLASLAALLVVPGAAGALAAPSPGVDGGCTDLDEVGCLAAVYYCSYALLVDGARLGDCLNRLDAAGPDEVCRMGLDADSVSRCGLRVVFCAVASAGGGACTA